MPVSAFVNAGEDLAARFLRLAGYTILSRNSRRFGAEVDILCRHAGQNELVLFEIKSGARSDFPALSPAQRRRLERAAQMLQAEAGRHLPIRLCLIMADAAHSLVTLTPVDF